MTARKKAAPKREPITMDNDNADQLPEVVTVENQLPTITPQESQYTGMLTLAIEKDLDIEKLERFMALQQSWEDEQARKHYLLAHSRFQSEVPVIHKKGHADFGDGKASYDYAKLEDIAEGIKPFLARNGLSYNWDCVIEGGLVRVTCTMSHIDGSSKTSTMVSTPDQSGGKAAIHQLASARSYLKRYTLLDVAGVTVAGEDDDAQAEAQLADSVDQTVYFDQKKFDSMFPSMQKQILEANKDPDGLILWLEEKGKCSLTEEQKASIRNIGK